MERNVISKPFRRIIRPFDPMGLAYPASPGQYEYTSGSSSENHLSDPDYAPSRVNLLHAFKMIEHDLARLFEYVEPADENLSTFSHRLYELLLRASTEFEANCRGILKANSYGRKAAKGWNIVDYHLLNGSSRLAEYEVKIGIWQGDRSVFQPFADWATGHLLNWYASYNEVKHDRDTHFAKASLENVLLATSGVLAVLFSQFAVQCFCADPPVSMWHHSDDGWIWHDECMFAVRPPQCWTADEFYSFDWSQLAAQTERFDNYHFE
jgi:hypothetical protein